MKAFGIIALCVGVLASLVGCNDSKRGSAVDFERLRQELREGDLLFRRGMGVLGRAVTATDHDGRFSHVGIAVKVDGAWHVIHAVPDEREFEGDFDRVKCEPVELFFDQMRAGNGAVYRVNIAPKQIDVAVAHARRLSADKRRFDHDYNLSDTTEMYCTELVEFIFAQSGVSISEGRLTHVNFPSMTGNYIMPSDLTKNSKLNPIYSF